MGKKKTKITVEGKEVDLGKIKSIRWTLDIKVSKDEFDKLVKTMLTPKKHTKTKDKGK